MTSVGEPLDLGRLAGEAARRFGDRPAFASAAGAMTFREFDRRSDGLAIELARRGIRAGEVVALILPTDLDYPLCYLAAAKLGAVTAGINTRLPAGQQAALLEHVTPALVISEAPEIPGFSGNVSTVADLSNGSAAGEAP